MNLPKTFALSAMIAALVSAPAHAVPGGQLHTLLQGPWSCEVPGDATVMPTPKPEENFRVTADSSYFVGEQRGNYLLLGDQLSITSGPFNGRRYVMDSDAMMHRLAEDGKPTRLRCVRAGTPAGDFATAMPGTN